MSIPEPKGYAIQARVNTESMQADGSVRPSGGELTTFHLPAGPGVRVDTFGYPGYRANPNFDSLLAKVIAHAASGGFETAVQRLARALREFQIGGVATNAAFLRNVLRHEDFASGGIYTRWLDDNVETLVSMDGAPSADLCPGINENNAFLDSNNDDIGDQCRCGDQTGDGFISAFDIGGTAQCANGQLPLLECDSTRVDTNGDNATTAVDISAVSQAVNGILATSDLLCVRYPAQ